MDNDQLVESDTEIVQILNDFFPSVFTTEYMSVDMEMSNISCTLEDVTKGLLKLGKCFSVCWEDLFQCMLGRFISVYVG